MRLAWSHLLRRLSPRAVIAAAVLVACTVTGVSTAGSSDTGEIERDENLIAWAERGAAEQRARDEARRHQRATPEARAEREASRTRFRDLDAGVALEVARTRHKGVVEAPAFRALRLTPGEQLVRFVSDHTAQVELEGKPGGALVESTLPMRARTGESAVRPLDLRLEDRGAWLSPQVSLTPVRISKRADQAVLMEGSGVGFRPAGAAPSEARVVADKAFYAEIEPDTDYLVQPLPTGVESFYQLRSPASPQQLTVALDLPEGARARRVARPFPSIEVVRGDELLGRFLPPNAWDADREPVRVEYAVAGSSLILTIPHASRDIAYPILVDPTWTEDQRFWYTATPPPDHPNSLPGLKDHHGWVYREYDTNDGFSMTEVWGEPSGGFILQADPDANWGRFNEMNYDAPPETHIYRFESLTKHWSYGSSIHIGLWSNSSTGWDPTHVYDQNAFHWGVFSPLSFYTSYYEQAAYVTECAGNNPCWPYNSNGTPAGTRGNKAVILLRRDNGVTDYPTVWFGGGQVSLLDDTAPNLVSLSENAPDGWVENANFNASATATDGGFGVAQFELWRRAPNGAKLQEKPLGVDVWPLTSQWSGQCEYTRRPVHCLANDQKTFSHSTAGDPDGVVTYGVRAQDMVSNWSGYSEFTVKLDRSAPRIDVTGGALWDQRNQVADHRNEGLYDETAPLHVEAVDDHSGARSIEVYVDGVSQRSRGGYVSTDCPVTGACRRTLDWTLRPDDYPDGDHTIRIVARDQLADSNGSTANAHTAIREFQVTVDRRGDVYRATHYTADPAAGGVEIDREWARLGTFHGRHEDAEEIATRTVVSCDGSTCDEARSRSDHSDAYGQHNLFAIHTGSREHDPELPRPVRISQIGSESVTEIGRGDLVSALQSWQVPPPAHGSEYVLVEGAFDSGGTNGDDADDAGSPNDAQVFRAWLDERTRYPVKVVGLLDGQVLFTHRWTYRVGRYEGSELPADHFQVARPASVAHEENVKYEGGQPAGPQTDAETQSTFRPQSLGTMPLLPSGAPYCLTSLDVVNMADAPPPPGTETFNASWILPNPDQVEDPTGIDPAEPPSLVRDEPHTDALAETFSAAGYHALPSGQSCAPGSGGPDTAPLQVITMARTSSMASAHRRAHQEAAAAVQTMPLHEDALRAGVQPVVLGASVATAYVVVISPTRVAAFLDIGDLSVIVQGPFSRADVPYLANLLEDR